MPSFSRILEPIAEKKGQNSISFHLGSSSKKKSSRSHNTRPQSASRARTETQLRDLSNFSTGGSSTVEKSDSGGTRGTLENEYLIEIRSRIDQQLTYPNYLRKRRLQGHLDLRIVLHPSGRLDSIQIQRTSNYPDLDQFVLESIQEILADSLPPPQVALQDKMILRIPIEFKLN